MGLNEKKCERVYTSGEAALNYLSNNLKKLNTSGIPEEYLIRHDEYTELSKAESAFLLEHITF